MLRIYVNFIRDGRDDVYCKDYDTSIIPKVGDFIRISVNNAFKNIDIEIDKIIYDFDKSLHRVYLKDYIIDFEKISEKLYSDSTLQMIKEKNWSNLGNKNSEPH